MFTTEIRIVDYTKRAALSRALFENVTSTLPGEKLDEKLASITFSNGVPDCEYSLIRTFRSASRSVSTSSKFG